MLYNITKKFKNKYYVMLCNMDEREQILRENFKEYLDYAERAFHEKKYNPAVTLFFKAICAGVDLFLFLQEGMVPSSHTQRFRIIKQKFSSLYDILDRDFPFYQDSYTHRMNKEAAEVLRDDAYTIKAMVEKRTER